MANGGYSPLATSTVDIAVTYLVNQNYTCEVQRFIKLFFPRQRVSEYVYLH